MSSAKNKFSTNDFDFWWAQSGNFVEAPNHRRGGESGVQRVLHPEFGTLYVKKQTGHTFRNFRHPFGLPTIAREMAAYGKLSSLGIKTPELVYGGMQKKNGLWHAILVTKDLAGYSCLNTWHREGGPERIGSERYARLLEQIGHTLGRLHRHRWRHGSLNGSHLFVGPDCMGGSPDIALIDLEKSGHALSPGLAARRDLRTLHRRVFLGQNAPAHPEEKWNILLTAHRKSLSESG